MEETPKVSVSEILINNLKSLGVDEIQAGSFISFAILLTKLFIGLINAIDTSEDGSGKEGLKFFMWLNIYIMHVGMIFAGMTVFLKFSISKEVSHDFLWFLIPAIVLAFLRCFIHKTKFDVVARAKLFVSSSVVSQILESVKICVIFLLFILAIVLGLLSQSFWLPWLSEIIAIGIILIAIVYSLSWYYESAELNWKSYGFIVLILAAVVAMLPIISSYATEIFPKEIFSGDFFFDF